jgi:hypothetical protein
MSNGYDRLKKRQALSEDVTRRILARASEIDSVRSTGLALDDLRQASLEAGIAPDAFEQALVEVGEGYAVVASESATVAPRIRSRFVAALLGTSKTVGVTLATMFVLMLLVDWLG